MPKKAIIAVSITIELPVSDPIDALAVDGVDEIVLRTYIEHTMLKALRPYLDRPLLSKPRIADFRVIRGDRRKFSQPQSGVFPSKRKKAR